MLIIARFLEKITQSSGVIAALIIIPLILSTCYEVFARYAFGAPTIWAYELGYMGMGAHFLLGMAYTLKEKAHIRIDLIYAFRGPRTKAAIDFFSYAVIMLPFTIWLTWGLFMYYEEALMFEETSGQSAWNPVIWPFRLCMMIGFILLAIQLLAESLKCLSVLIGQSASLEEAE